MGKILDANKACHKISLEQILLGELSNSNDWQKICKYYILSEDLMERFIKKIDFNIISVYQKLSLDFIKKHFKKLNVRLLMNQKFDEDTLNYYLSQNETYYYVTYTAIFKYQELSSDFILQHIKTNSQLLAFTILENQKINYDILNNKNIEIPIDEMINAITHNKVLTKGKRKEYIDYLNNRK